MTDRHLMKQIEQTLETLNASVEVIDRSDNLTNRLPRPVQAAQEGELLSEGGRLYLPLGDPDLVLACPDDTPGGADILRLAGLTVRGIAMHSSHAESRFDVYRRLMAGELTDAELDGLSYEHQIPREMRRAVLVFHMVETDQQSAFQILDELAPIETNDVLLDIDRHTAALIKDVTDQDDTDELVQYAEALQETVMGETASMMTVGIGSERLLLRELRMSYREARRAIEVGKMFEPGVTVHVYQKLIFQRFLLELPTEVSRYYHQLLFNEDTERLFNDEILYTIEMFFRKDLNLSDTARQLYIHRNTLVYRLDKIQKQAGIDLRKFDDAVTFKLLMELKKCMNRDI